MPCGQATHLEEQVLDIESRVIASIFARLLQGPMAVKTDTDTREVCFWQMYLSYT